jgi:hypothetical protein
MKKIAFVILSLMTLVFTSCLKDKNIDNKKYGTAGLGDIPLVLFPATRTTTSLNSSAKDTSFHLITVRLAESDPASEDVKVTLTPNNAAVTAAGFTPAPTSAYTLSDLVVTIPKGQREGYLTITTKTANLTAATYGFGFDIAAVSNPKYKIASTLKTTVAVLPIKNMYDGIYSVESGFVQRYTAPGAPTVGDVLNGSLAGNPDVTLSTVGSTTLEITNLKWAYPNGGIAGIDNLRLTVDPATNLVTMFALGNATLANWEGKENRYDPATRTFYLIFRWNPTANRREYSVVIKYKKPR